MIFITEIEVIHSFSQTLQFLVLTTRTAASEDIGFFIKGARMRSLCLVPFKTDLSLLCQLQRSSS